MKTRLLAFACFLLTALSATAQSPSDSGGQPQFDFYVLSLSWAPTYCESHPRDHSSECATGEHKGFVLHGLWPQNDSGQQLEACTAARPVAKALVEQMLQYMPSRGLIQHEWATHGTCSGLSPTDYFHQVLAAFNAVQIPDEYRNPDHTQKISLKELEERFASVNHAPVGAFRVSCHDQELVNLEVCLGKDLHYRACGGSVRECPATSVRLLAPK